MVNYMLEILIWKMLICQNPEILSTPLTQAERKEQSHVIYHNADY